MVVAFVNNADGDQNVAPNGVFKPRFVSETVSF